MTRLHTQTFATFACALLFACTDDPNTSHDASTADVVDTHTMDDNEVADDTSSDTGIDSAGSDVGDDATDIAEFEPDPPNGPAPLFLPPAMPGRHNVEVVDTRQVVPERGHPRAVDARQQQQQPRRGSFRGTCLARVADRARPLRLTRDAHSCDQQRRRSERGATRPRSSTRPTFASHACSSSTTRSFFYLAELGTNALGI
jgi:hypothetical protein